MRQIILFALFAFLSSSCSSLFDKNLEDSELVGEWELIEVLADPGDGSGTFNRVDSDKTITFASTGLVSSKNGSLCTIISSRDSDSGVYSSDNSLISSSSCENTNARFEINGSELIIKYSCFEACEEKYRKK